MHDAFRSFGRLTPFSMALVLAMTTACTRVAPPAPSSEASGGPPAGYFDNTGRTDTLSGGVRLVPIATRKGIFKVWTKRVGNNPRIKVLLLHGGPGATHEYFVAADSYFPAAGVE